MAPPPNGSALEVGPEEDKQLVLAFKAGDEDSYRAIYDRHAAAVRMACRRMLSNPQDREEAFQETFLKVYMALGRFNGRYQLGAWITRIATNVCLDMIRARGRKPCDPHTVEDLEQEMTTGETDGDPELSALRRFDAQTVLSALERLPVMHRSAIVMRYYDGLCYSDIARELGISESQTKALLHRARKSFRRSWRGAIVGALLPFRWVTKLRRIKGVEEEAVRSGRFFSDMAASVSNVASSCGVIAQQCGQIAAERFAVTATTMVLGAAALGAPAIANSLPGGNDPGPVSQAAVARSADDAGQAATVLHKRVSMKDVKPSQATRPETVPAPAPTPTPTEAAPAPAPTTPPESAGGTTPPGEEGKKPEPSPTATPTPAPFTAAVGFVGEGATPPARLPHSHAEEVNCDVQRMWQELDIDVAVNGATHRGKLKLWIAPHTGSTNLEISVGGRSYRYSSWGEAPVATWARSGSTATVSLSGYYGPLHDSHPTTANLPEAGRFISELTLDCTALRVVAQSVTFRPGQ